MQLLAASHGFSQQEAVFKQPWRCACAHNLKDDDPSIDWNRWSDAMSWVLRPLFRWRHHSRVLVSLLMSLSVSLCIL